MKRKRVSNKECAKGAVYFRDKREESLDKNLTNQYTIFYERVHKKQGGPTNAKNHREYP